MSGRDPPRESAGWELFYSLAKRVARMLQASGYEPDFIVGLTPGGWVLGRILGDLLGVKNMASLRVEHWDPAAGSDGRAPLTSPLRGDLSGRRVLMVDDVAGSEERMGKAVEFVRGLNPMEVRTAALWRIEGSGFTPDFCGDEVGRRPAILPWSFTRDLRAIVSELADECTDLDELRERIRRRHGIEVDAPRLSQALGELDRRPRG